MTLFDLPPSTPPPLEAARRELVELETRCEALQTELESRLPTVTRDEEAELHRLLDRKNATFARVRALEGEASRRAK
jgi:hypothetical protein